MTEKQKTIKNQVTVSGVGLHTGKTVNLTFKPSDANTGIRFLRNDLGEEAFVSACLSNVADTSRGTTLEENGIRIATVEHVMAAIAGFELDNLIVEVNAPETPIIDGSAKPYADALSKAGIAEQDALREEVEISEAIRFFNEEKDCEMIAIPSDRFRVSCMIDFDNKLIGTQYAYLNQLSDFKKEIAPSRTFVFLHELEYLLEKNLIKGGDLSNSIVFVDSQVEQSKLDKIAKVFNKPTVKIKNESILNNVELNFRNEPARHKLLDVLGDLALIGKPFKAHIIANKPGHTSNIEFAKKLKKYIKDKLASNHVPQYDPNEEPIHDVNYIKKLLPHRYPFLLVDKIIEISDSHVVGVKNVTMNETFFQGHFPKEPIMPGVLQIEAMAQTGGILVLSTVENPEEYSTYFLKMDNVRFKKKVVPGDTLIFKLSLMAPVRRGICHMRGTAYVGKSVVLEAELMAQIVKNKA